MAFRAALTIALPTEVAHTAVGFLGSCTDDYVEIRAGSMFLSANCRNDRGQAAVVRIDLDDCLSNSNGKLVCSPQNGGFWRTCEYNRKTTYNLGVLSMHCRNATGFLDWSSRDLSKKFHVWTRVSRERMNALDQLGAWAVLVLTSRLPIDTCLGNGNGRLTCASSR